MKNTMIEIRLNIDVRIIPTLYIVALDCIFTIAVGSASASIVINTLKATCCTGPDQTRPSQVMVLRYNGISQPDQTWDNIPDRGDQAIHYLLG